MERYQLAMELQFALSERISSPFFFFFLTYILSFSKNGSFSTFPLSSPFISQVVQVEQTTHRHCTFNSVRFPVLCHTCHSLDIKSACCLIRHTEAPLFFHHACSAHSIQVFTKCSPWRWVHF